MRWRGMRIPAVDEEVGGEVELDEEVSHRLKAHHPQGRDVCVILFHALNLNLWGTMKNIFEVLIAPQ